MTFARNPGASPILTAIKAYLNAMHDTNRLPDP